MFERGGLAVDAGRGPNTEVPPVVAWMNFPRDRRTLLILDPRLKAPMAKRKGEPLPACRVFQPKRRAKSVARALLQILPSAAEGDIEAFGDGVARIRKSSAIISLRSKAAPASSAAGEPGRNPIKGLKARGIGQSSSGSTGFAFASDPDHAQFLARRGSASKEPT